jgi:hypothetical protein
MDNRFLNKITRSRRVNRKGLALVSNIMVVELQLKPMHEFAIENRSMRPIILKKMDLVTPYKTASHIYNF